MLFDSENLVSVFTADHGMNFKCIECNGGHSAFEYRNNAAVKTVPFIILGNGAGEKQVSANNFDLLPTTFGYAGVENSCGEMLYCKGRDLD